MSIRAETWLPCGQFVAAAAANGPIQRLDRASGASLYQLAGYGFGTLDFSRYPDGTSQASAGQDGTTRLWNAAQSMKVAMLESGADGGKHVAWSPLDILAATAAGKPLKLGHFDGTRYHHVRPRPSTIAGMAWNADSTRLASICCGGI